MTDKLRTWAEVNLKNISENFDKIKNHTEKKVMCIVKADAYGHGLCEVAKTLKDADFFGVATTREALSLRESGVKNEILLLGYFNQEETELLVLNNITATIYSLEMAETLNEVSKKLCKKCKIHIKIDTGMSRLGFSTHEFDDIVKVTKLENLISEGIYTHFAVADDPLQKDFTFNQAENFDILCNKLEKSGISFKLKHTQASSALLLYNDFKYDMVRAGIALYGYTPNDDIENFLNLKPAMTIKSRVAFVHTLKKGQTVSYGRRFEALKDMKVAVVSIGYADGYKRSNQNEPYTLVSGKKAEVIGSICMDMCMIDVSNIDNLNQGDEVIIFGEKELTAMEVAKFSKTIVYEVLCSASSRVPRIYSK